MKKPKIIITGIIPRDCKLKELIGKKITYYEHKVAIIKTAKVYGCNKDYIEYTAEVCSEAFSLAIRRGFSSFSIGSRGVELEKNKFKEVKT